MMTPPLNGDKTKISSTSTISYLFIIPKVNPLYFKVTQCNGGFLKNHKLYKQKHISMIIHVCYMLVYEQKLDMKPS